MGRDDDIAYKINLLKERVREYSKANVDIFDGFKVNRSSDLSYRQVEILFTIEYMDIHNISKLTELMGLNKSTLSILVNKLVNKKYVYKQRAEGSDDGRKVYFHLTEAGRRAIVERQQSNMKKFIFTYSNFSDEKKEYFRKGTQCLRLIAERTDPVAVNIINKMLVNEEASPELTKVAEDISFFVISVFMDAEKPIGVHCTKSGITFNQLLLLHSIADLELNSVSRLEKHIGSSASTISITISKMADNGYIRKEKFENEMDGRAVRLVVTEKGFEILKKENEEHQRTLLNYINSLNSEKVVIFAEGLDYLLKVFN